MDEADNPWENFRPPTSRVDIAEVAREYSRQSMADLDYLKTIRRTKKYFEDEYGQDISLVGTVKVLNGSKPRLAVSKRTHRGVFRTIFEVSIEEDKNLVADIKANGKEKRVSFTGTKVKGKGVNEVFLSRALANELGVKNGDEIEIFDVYTDPDEVDLDDY